MLATIFWSVFLRTGQVAIESSMTLLCGLLVAGVMRRAGDVTPNTEARPVLPPDVRTLVDLFRWRVATTPAAEAYLRRSNVGKGWRESAITAGWWRSCST